MQTLARRGERMSTVSTSAPSSVVYRHLEVRPSAAVAKSASSGGTSALNKYAQGHGAKESAFYDPNTTTSSDLARLWVLQTSRG